MITSKKKLYGLDIIIFLFQKILIQVAGIAQ
jgi:hypothetical protein